MRPDIAPGATLPDFELPDHTGHRRRLSDLQGQDPLVLILARGFFCPKDHRQHAELVDFYPQIAVAYTAIVTISTDTVATSRTFRKAVGAQWPFLADPGRVVQRALDIAEYSDPVHDPMIPHTFVLEPGLLIARIYNGYWYWGRPSPEDLRRDLREVFRRVRPDWDLGAPDLRTAWEQGDRTRFYPYQAGGRARSRRKLDP